MPEDVAVERGNADVVARNDYLAALQNGAGIVGGAAEGRGGYQPLELVRGDYNAVFVDVHVDPGEVVGGENLQRGLAVGIGYLHLSVLDGKGYLLAFELFDEIRKIPAGHADVALFINFSLYPLLNGYFAVGGG